MLRVALRFFVLGFVAGTLFAPRAGADTRAIVMEKLSSLANGLAEIAALPPIVPERASSDGGGSPRARRPHGAHASGAREAS
jgi:hypothetical protein